MCHLCCVVPAACWVFAGCLLRVVCFVLLCDGRCLAYDVCCVLFVVCCVLFVVRCVLRVVCCALVGGR